MDVTHNYSSTLSNFYEASNELIEFCLIYHNEIFPSLIEFINREDIKWLDIGPGDGNKAETMFWSIAGLKTDNLSLTLSEPDDSWSVILRQKFYPKRCNGINISIDNRNLEYIINNDQNKYSFISLHHLLYERKLTDLFLGWCFSNRTRGEGTIYYVSIENQDNIIFQIRQVLKSEGMENLPQSQSEYLIQQLLDNKVHFNKVSTANKIFIPSTVEDEYENWIYPFVLGISEKTYLNLETNKRSLIEKTIRDNLSASAMLPINEDHIVFMI